jgi:site-specific DNA-adenine methylase
VFSRDGDFLYLDPPYKSERSRLYLGRFDHDEFYGWLKKQRAGWALSMNSPDSESDGEDFVPEIYDERFELPNGTSAVRRLSGLEAPSVTESLYVRAASQ